MKVLGRKIRVDPTLASLVIIVAALVTWAIAGYVFNLSF